MIKRKSNTFVLLLIMMFLMEFSRGMFVLSYLPGIPAISDHISIGIASICVTLHFISDAVSNIFIGQLMKKYGAKLILLISFIIGITGFIIIFIVNHNVSYVIASVLLGISVCPIWVISLASINSQQQGKQIGYVYFVWLLGLVLGMILMNVLMNIHPKNFLIIIPILMGMNIVALYFSSVCVTLENKNGMRAQLKQIKKIVRFTLAIIPGILLQGTAIGMLIPILPTFFVEELNLEFYHYTMALVIGGILCSFVMVVTGRVLDHFRSCVTHYIIVTCFTVFTVVMFLISNLHQIVIILVLGASAGLVFGTMLPAWNKFMAQSIQDELKEETWGFFNFVQGFGTMVGPVVGGMTAEIVGSVNSTFYISGTLFLVLVIFYAVYFFVKKRKHVHFE